MPKLLLQKPPLHSFPFLIHSHIHSLHLRSWLLYVFVGGTTLYLRIPSHSAVQSLFTHARLPMQQHFLASKQFVNLLE